MTGGGSHPADLTRRSRIGAAFAAARDYDRHARIQLEVARKLAGVVRTLSLPAAPRLLEIGCGTGFLTGELIRVGLGGHWLVTDLAPAMLERCRARLGETAERQFAVLDGERGPRPREAPFDLIVANLAFQWFDDLAASIQRLGHWLVPGGHLLFTTLVAGTFAEWRAAHAAHGLAPGTPDFLTPGDLASAAPPGFTAAITLDRLTQPHGTARQFLHAVKAIGAGTSAPGHRPLPPSALRRVMHTFEAGGAAATYVVATCHYHRSAP